MAYHDFTFDGSFEDAKDFAYSAGFEIGCFYGTDIDGMESGYISSNLTPAGIVKHADGYFFIGTK